MSEELELLKFKRACNNGNIIKVLGVGGGGGNAVNHMYRQGIKDVSFVVCNTDSQALFASPIENKLCLGSETTKGLGAGNDPLKAQKAAEESTDEIKKMLYDGTEMVFITAGMGGGTGTGAAPVVAGIAKSLGLLTVGIVTIPFAWEGRKKIEQALSGVKQMAKNVDSLLVINNESLRELFPDMDIREGFAQADNVLTSAAKGIAEIITVNGHINLDFADVSTTMRDGGVAVMNTGIGSGESRLLKAFHNALESPLIKQVDLRRAEKLLFNIYCSSTNAIKMEETAEITEFVDGINPDINVIWGITFDDTLGENVKITIITTGFNIEEEIENLTAEIEKKYFGKKSTRSVSTFTKTQSQKPSNDDSWNFVFDDEDVLEELKNTPAYLRKKN